MRLVTIPFSHFCEKARWALDQAALAYVEEPHAPMLAWAPAVTASGQRQVPVLVPVDAAAVTGSTNILRWADARRKDDVAPLWPEDMDRELTTYVAELDRALGPAARRVGYACLLRDMTLTCQILAAAARGWERRVVETGARALAASIRRGLRIDERGVARSVQVLERVFDDADARLAKAPFLAGDSFTAADVTFASLAGPVLFTPPVEAHTCTLSRLPAAAQDEIERWRARPAGAFALRLYAESRPRSCGSSR
jgi:glutathione S-transferase